MRIAVWELCTDDFHDSYEGAPKDGSAWRSENYHTKVVHGGSWDNDPVICRSAFRNYSSRDLRSDALGFRVVYVISRTT